MIRCLRCVVCTLLLLPVLTNASFAANYLDVTASVVLSPASVAFSDTPVGATSGIQNVSYLNDTASGITVNSVSSSSAEFPVSTTCPVGSTLAAHSSCNIAVRFTPASTGARSGSISIVDSAAGSPRTVPLSGNGLPSNTTPPPVLQQLVTNQTALPIADRFSRAENPDINDAGTFVFGAGERSGLFVRNAATGVVTRLAQIGDPAPGVDGATFSYVPYSISLNSSGNFVFTAWWTAPSKSGGSIFLSDGTNVQALVRSTDTPPDGGYYSWFNNYVKLNDLGDIGFVNNYIFQSSTVFGYSVYVLPHGGSVVRVAGAGDSVPGLIGTINNVSGTLSNINNLGQVLFTADVVGGAGGSGIFRASTAGIEKIAASGDSEPGLGSVFSSYFAKVGFNIVTSKSGYIAFYSDDGYIWRYSSASGLLKVAGPGDAGPSSVGGSINQVNPRTLTVSDSGVVVFGASMRLTTASSVVFRWNPANGLQVVASSGMAVGSQTLRGFFDAVSINSSDVVAFEDAVNQGGWMIATQSGSNPPVKLISSSDSPPMAGGGTYRSDVSPGSLRLLSDGSAYLESYIAGGASSYASLRASAGGVSMLTATENTLPAGAITTISNYDVTTRGDWVGFRARKAGGTLAYFVHQQSTGTIYKVIQDGDTVSANGPKPLQLVSQTSVFVNSHGQVLFQSDYETYGLFLWDPANGIKRIVKAGDSDSTGGGIGYPRINYYGSMPLNNAGQVVFRSDYCPAEPWLAPCTYAVMRGAVGVPPVKVAANGDAVPGGGGTFSILNSYFDQSNTDLINDSGQVAFIAGVNNGTTKLPGFFIGTPGSGLTRVAVLGDTVPGTSATYSHLPSAFSFNNAGELAFMADLAVIPYSPSVLVGTYASPVRIIVSQEDPPFNGALPFLATSNALINDQHDILFTPFYYQAGVYLRRGGGTTWESVFGPPGCDVYNTDDPPAAENFALSPSGVAFISQYLVVNNFCRQALFRYRQSGVLDTVAKAGDTAPASGGGTFSSFPKHLWSDNSPAFYSTISGGSIKEAIYRINPAVADLALSATVPAFSNPGGNTLALSYTVTNNGPSTAAGATLSLTLPAGVTYSSSSVQCTGTSTIVCPMGNIAVGATSSAQISVNAASASNFMLSASTSGNDADSILANNSTSNLVIADAPPMGNLDVALSASGGTSTVVQNTNLWVSGWGADPEDKAPIAKVEIRIDGSLIGNATLGTARPDVATALGSSLFINSGWWISYNIGSLSTGSHTVAALAYDSAGASKSLGSKSITVAAPNAAPFGNLEVAVSASGGTSTVAQNTNVWVSGWATDQEDKAPVSKVEIRIDGNLIGNATLSQARSDVATALGSSAYTNSGWWIVYNIGTLSAGSHTVSATAFDAVGATGSLGSKSITVTVPNTAPFGNVDVAVSASGGTSTIVQNTNLWVSGWAGDQEDKAPVTTVEIRIDGNLIGNATLGTARPDVAAALGSSAYTNSGWWISYNIGVLTSGTHVVSAVAYDSLGAGTSLGSQNISVSTP